DPNGQEVATATVSTNDFGTAAGELVVPAGRPLGSWRLRGTLPGEAAIQVEEYKRPTFEVTLQEPAAAPRLNRPAAFRGEARYYFGLPVASGRGRWRGPRARPSIRTGGGGTGTSPAAPRGAAARPSSPRERRPSTPTAASPRVSL